MIRFFLLIATIWGVVSPTLPILVLAGSDVQWVELNKQTTGYYKQQDFIKGAAAARAALQVARKEAASHPEHLIISLNNLAMMQTHLGGFAEAEQLNKEALGVVQKYFGMTDPKAMVSWNNLGLIYYFAKKYDDAEHCFREALYIAEQHYGKQAREIIAPLKRLASFYKKVGWQQKEAAVTARMTALTAAISRKKK